MAAMRHLLRSNNNGYLYCFSTHQIRRIATADATLDHSTCGVKRQKKLKEVARRVCDVIRRRPTWESTLLSEFPQEDLLHPSCIAEIFRRQSGNALLTLRFYLWLSSHQGANRFSPEAILSALSKAKAWKASLHFLRSTKCRPQTSSLESFAARLCEEGNDLEESLETILELKRVLDFSPSLLLTWNTALSRSLRIGRTDLVWRFYEEMINCGIAGDATTIRCIAQAFCKEGKMSEALELLRDISKGGVMTPDAFTFNKLVSGFCRAKNYEKVSETLHLMIQIGCKPTIFTYQEVIYGLCRNGMAGEAYRVFNDIKYRGYVHNVFSYTMMIDGLCKMGQVEHARDVWQEMMRNGLVPNEYTYNVVVYGYCKMGDMDEAKKMYEEMLSRGCKESIVSCNTMIGGLCSNGRIDEAWEWFERMPDRGIDRDSNTYSIMIQGFCQGGRMKEALDLYYNLLEVGLQPRVAFYTRMIQAFCEEGNVSMATEILNDMVSRGLEPLVITHDYMISGHCRRGDACTAMGLLWKMLKGKMRPRCATFENLVESLSLADRAGDALRVLDAMYKAGYVLGTSLCHSLVGRLCSENHQHAGEHLEEVLGR
ncbi:hypothetical protein QJS04_geneDACA021031 [Acorus gramineus]|uniref:Pentatricopeptide repeat-containing protein n=1 Tax=Acorus gramineus TaxID=55184 RepID=A0AAV9B375_ACOGR|nr:hypothetical protein QJS04_geneDACA021031 [Acorus gramineus]